MNGGYRSRLVVLSWVGTAALVGALLAVSVLALRGHTGHPLRLGVIALSAVAFCLLAGANLLSLPPREVEPGSVETGQAFGWTQPPDVRGDGSRWVPPPPEPPRSGGNRAAPNGSRPAPVNFAVAVDTSAPVASPLGAAELTVPTRIVQCARCADFAVDLRRQNPGFAFRCHSCGHEWLWEPGTAWPTTVVRPGSRAATDARFRSS
ncbi:MAG: hypothetical protein ACKVZ6_19475 [Kineosporiaceae bacterium]|jgi:hypothetical protein